MSYYSQVGLALSKEGEDRLQEALENCGDKKILDFVRKCSVTKVVDEKSGSLRIWNEVEWKNENEGVKFVERQLGFMLESYFLFIRIGEGTGDIEEYGDYYQNEFDFGWETRLIYHI